MLVVCTNGLALSHLRSYLIALLALFTAYARVEKVSDDSITNKERKSMRTKVYRTKGISQSGRLVFEGENDILCEDWSHTHPV